MATLKYHPDLWLRDDAAAAINALEDKYGPIVINSAGRTVQQQQELIDRWLAGDPNVYMPYRPAEGSPHVRNGGIAVDIYNYTDDRAKMEEFGFQWTYGMDDPVHYDYIGWSGGGGAVKWPSREKYGADWVASGQAKLQRLGYDIGPDGADGYDGPATQTATKQLQARGGLEQDGIYGPNANDLADRLLAVRNGHRAFPLPSGYYFGPQDGPVESVSGFYSYREDLQVWQQQMKNRGWFIDPDGLYGQATRDVAAAFQEEKGLYVDGLIGPDTWNLAWEAPVTPPGGGGGTPVDPMPPVTEIPGRNATDRPLKEIQKYLGVKQTGNWDKATSDAVLDFQKRAHVDEDYIWGVTCDGLAFPPAGALLFGVDYSFARPDPKTLAERNIKFAGRYLWKPKYDDGVRTNKGISIAEYNSLKANGIAPFFFYEEDATDPIQGFEEGVRQAKSAEAHRVREGLPALPIYFPVDYDAPDSAIPAIIEGLRGAATVVGIDRVGVYAKYSVVQAAFNAGVIKFACQTYAWSGGKWDPRAQLRQWSNGQYGDTVDFQYAMAAEYGQTPVDSKPVDPEPGNNDKETVRDIAETLKLAADKLIEIAGRM